MYLYGYMLIRKYELNQPRLRPSMRLLEPAFTEQETAELRARVYALEDWADLLTPSLE